MVTGCTDGIGKAYCKEFASKGINIVLVSRSEQKLNATAKELGKHANDGATSTVKTKTTSVTYRGCRLMWKFTNFRKWI